MIQVVNLNPASFSEEQANAFAILTNVSEEAFNRIKSALRLSNPSVLGPGTLDAVMEAFARKGLDLSNTGVIAFKDRLLPGGNQGAMRGKIGPQTATLYIHQLLLTEGIAFLTTYAANELAPHLQEIRLRGYEAIIGDASQEFNLQSSIIAGVGSRESLWGIILNPPGPGGVGDGGHGKGLMQIDDGAHEFARTGNWQDPRANVFFGCGILADQREALKREGLTGRTLLRFTLASYNAGLGAVLRALDRGIDPDDVTTGGDYGRDVLDRAGWFQRFADLD